MFSVDHEGERHCCYYSHVPSLDLRHSPGMADKVIKVIVLAWRIPDFPHNVKYSIPVSRGQHSSELIYVASMV